SFYLLIFFFMILRPQRSTLFPYTTLFRSRRVMKSRIMYIELKQADHNDNGPARIGRVTFSKTGRTIYYKGKAFQSLKGSGICARSEEHTSELQSLAYLVCRLLLEKKKKKK